ncbi:MAG: SMP-30/gluconolactonase/LRE family protein [Gammaproteobacteria bacterium]|nr:SMP-30/gluconolactonase/LRE family protein [Gammaproteobacteria bacterium]
MNFFAKPEIVCTGFRFVEGPVWVDDGSPLLAGTGARSGALIFSDIPASRLCWFADGRTGILREPTGQANGNALDPGGMLISCEHENRCVSRFDGKHAARRFVQRFEGKRLNSPNDVPVHSDGLIFFTDPPYAVAPEDRELDFQGIYCVEPESADPTLLNDEFDKPNGLAFSPDETSLYIADTERGHVRRFSAGSDGTLSDDRVFCDCERPDGICVDTAGNVWVACMEGVEIFAPDGRRIGFIALPERPANIAFGDADGSTLYICARTSIYAVETEATGALARRGRSAAEACCS